MKTRSLVIMAFMPVVVCGMFAVSAVIAATCYDLGKEWCVTPTGCELSCTPECGDVYDKAVYAVDKCKCKATGYSTCEAHPTDEVDCYEKWNCAASTNTCSSDAAEKQCDESGGSTLVKTSKKILSDSGCSGSE